MIVDEKILQDVIQKWGPEAQIKMLHEEFGELMSALNKYDRGRVSIIEVQEEIADCLMMLQQMRYIFGAKDVDEWVTIKTDRVKGRLADPERKQL